MSRQERVEVVFSTKGSDTFTRDLKNMQTNMKAVDAQIKLASTNLKVYGTNLVNLKQKQQALQTQMANVRKEIDKYNEGIEKNQKNIEKNKESIAQLTQKKKELKEQLNQVKKAFGEESEEAQKLSTDLKRVSDDITELKNKNKDAERSMDNYTTKIANAQNKLSQLDGELRNVNDKLWEQSNRFYQAGKSLEEAGSMIQRFGGFCSEAGDKILGITIPLMSLLGLATKLGIDFEYNMSKVKSIANLTASEMEMLEAKAKQMGSETAKSANDASMAFQYMSLAGWDVNQMLTGIEPILKASVAYDAELASTSDLVTDSMSTLGIEVQDLSYYLDILTSAQNNSNTTATALMEAYIGCGGILKQLNVPLEESSTLLGILANQGKKGSEAGNALSSILVNLTKKSGESADALEEMGISAFDTQGNFKGVTNVLKEVNEKFKDYNDEQKTTYSAMIGGKEQLDTFTMLLSGLGDQYDKLYSKQEHVTGSLEKMYDTMQDNTKGRINMLMSNLESLGLELADIFLPHINALLPELNKLIDSFKNLDSDVKEGAIQLLTMSTGLGLILKVSGAVISPIGTVTKTFGKLVSSIALGKKGIDEFIKAYNRVKDVQKANNLFGITKRFKEVFNELKNSDKTINENVVTVQKWIKNASIATAVIAGVATAVYATAEYFDAMNNTCTKSAEEMSFLEKAFTNLTGGTVRTRSELEKLGLVEEDLNEKFSKDFVKAVELSEKAVEEFNFQLNNMSLDGILDASELDKIKSNVDELCDSTISTIESRKGEIMKAFNSAFSDDGNIDAKESSLINYFRNQFDSAEQEVKQCQENINKIRQEIEANGYEVTPEQIEKIREYENRIAQIKIEMMANNEQELEFAQNKWRARVDNLDAESASKMAVKRKEELDNARAEEKASYETSLNYLKSHLDEMSGQEKQNALDQIDILEFKLSNIDEKYADFYAQDLQYLYDHNKNLEGEINRFTGELLTESEKKNVRELENTKSHYQNLHTVTKSGWYRMYNTLTGTYKDLYVQYDEHNKEIMGITEYSLHDYGLKAEKTVGYNDDMIDSTARLADEYRNKYNNIIYALNQAESATVDANGNIVSSNGTTIASFDEVSESVNGVRTGIIMVGDTPVRVEFDDKTGAIRNANEIRQSIENIPAEKNVKVNVIYNGTGTFSDGRGNVWVDGKQIMGSNSYAEGTNYAPEGIHEVNEAGYELVDSINNSARALAGTMAYLPEGTKVTNHLMTTMKMKADIKHEVAKAIAGKDDSSTNIEVNVGGSEIIVQGNLDNVSLEQLNRTIAKNNKQLKDTIYSEMNKVTKKY